MKQLTFAIVAALAMVAQAWEVGDDITLGEGESFAIPAGVTRVGDVKMAAGSTLQLPSDVDDITFASLNGDGTITSDYPGGDWSGQILQIGTGGSTPPKCPVSVFAGKFVGYIRLSACWTLELTNEESPFAWGHNFHNAYGGLVDPNGLKGVLAVTKLGNIRGVSSIGPADNIQLQQGGTLRYLGKGETTNHGLTPLHGGVNLDSCVDGGAFGGLNWAGEWYCSLKDVFCRMTVTGSNTTACVMSGAMNFDAAPNGMSCYFTKDGTGTWSFAGNDNRPKMCGPFAIREGTLQFDTLANTGVSCSLGTSTALYDAPGGSGMSGAEQYKVDYAFLLGGGENPVFEFIGSGENATDRKIALTGGKSTIAAPGAGKISFNGGVKALDEGLKTLHLAGSAYIADIADGAGKVSIVKEGAGEWTLGGELSFSGLFEVAEGKATVVADNGKVQLANASVKVAPGATLAASGVELKAITLDAVSGSGTFEGVAFAKDGVIDVVNPQSAPTTTAIAFKEVDAGSLANLKGWKVKVEGITRSGATVTFNGDGTVTIATDNWEEGDDITLGEGESFAIPAGVTRVGDVTMAAGSILQLPSDMSDITFASLNGDGTITSDFAGGAWVGQMLNIGGSKTQSVSTFAGKFVGYIRLSAKMTLELLNEESPFAVAYNFHNAYGADGVLAAAKFGSIRGVSSIGPADNIQLQQGGTLRYLGKGETTNHGLTPLHSGVNLDSCVDGGAFGGLNWAGEWYCSLNNVFCRMTVTGSNTTACVMSGAMNFDAAPNGMSCYFTKEGTGTWSFAGNANRPKMRGPFAVREGTLQFDTLFNAGESCSLGTSDALYDAPAGSGIDGAEQYKVDYAFLLGGGENPVFEFVGSGENATDRKIALTGGKSTIAATGAGKISFNGGVKALDEGLKTLHLAGSAHIADIADGAGKVSVVKEGAGEWTLGGELSFSGLFEVAEGKATVVADNGKVQLANASVKVAPGATLAASGVELKAITLDAVSGSGTFDGVAFAKDGVIDVVNPQSAPTTAAITFKNVDAGSLANLKGWKVSVKGGTGRGGAKVTFNDDGTVTVTAIGAMGIFLYDRPTVMNAAQFGLSPTASAEVNTRALNEALRGGNRLVQVSKPGVYELNNTVFLDSHTTLNCVEGVVFKRTASYPHMFVNRSAYDWDTTKFEEDIELHNLELDVNGMGKLDDYDQPCKGLRGHIAFFKTRDVRVYNLTCLDFAEMYCIQFCDFDGVVVDGFTIRGAKDGIHFNRGKNFVVRNGVLRTGDDGIALNAGDWPLLCTPTMGSIENGLVENVTDEMGGACNFARVITGAWTDWYPGMPLQRGDICVVGTNVYTVAFAQLSTNETVSYTAPTHTRGVWTSPEGIPFLFLQGDGTRRADIRNVTFRNCTLEAERQISCNWEICEYARLIHPAVKDEDYPVIDIKLENVHKTTPGHDYFILGRANAKIELRDCSVASGPLVYLYRHSSARPDYLTRWEVKVNDGEWVKKVGEENIWITGK